MPRWEYRAYTGRGEIVTGRLTAETERAAFGGVESLGLVPIELKPLVRKTKKHLFKLSGNTPEESLMFVRQLSSLVNAGVTMLRAIASLADLQIDEANRRRIIAIGEALRQGRSLSGALTEHMPGLPPYVPYLVEVGETTGDMSQALEAAGQQLERDLAVARDIRSALTYPIFLICFGVVAVAFMFAVVVPQFTAMLDKSSAQLPTISLIVIGAGQGMRAYAYELMSGIVGLVLLLGVLSRRPGFASAMFQFVLSLPGIGHVVRTTEAARWSSMLATLLASKVTITDAIMVANRIVKDARLRASLALVDGALRRGARLSDALEDFTRLDLRVIEMVRIGEQSGGLHQMLVASSDLLRSEADSARRRFIALIEPIAVLMIGGTIGTIVVGLMLAISSLYDKVL